MGSSWTSDAANVHSWYVSGVMVSVKDGISRVRNVHLLCRQRDCVSALNVDCVVGTVKFEILDESGVTIPPWRGQRVKGTVRSLFPTRVRPKLKGCRGRTLAKRSLLTRRPTWSDAAQVRALHHRRKSCRQRLLSARGWTWWTRQGERSSLCRGRWPRALQFS